MRADATQYDLTAPATLHAALAHLAAHPGRLTPIAGGTELMVALAAGRLTQHTLISIQHLQELRFIRTESDAVIIGAGSTFTDIRHNDTIAKHFPLLAQAASWTGSIANQNRATLGGNLCNASPAADSPPALFAYDASVTLVSTRGERTIPYTGFHLSYKNTALAPDELLLSIRIPFPAADAKQYIRKVGPRNAQAISKVALACVASVHNSTITEIKIGAASIADRPVRCFAAEAALQGAKFSEATIRAARAAIIAEAKPIDDIRSTARYRTAIAANLLEEFLRSLA